RGTRCPWDAAAKAQEKPGTVGQDEITSDSFVRAFLRLITFDRQFGSDLYRILGDSKADQGIRAAAFDHPFRDLTARILHIEVEPGMWVDHFPLRERSFERQRLIHVKLGRKGVMGPD